MVIPRAVDSGNDPGGLDPRRRYDECTTFSEENGSSGPAPLSPRRFGRGPPYRHRQVGIDARAFAPVGRGDPMIRPGRISRAFQRRPPAPTQLFLGLAATITFSALFGHGSPPGPLTTWGSAVVAVISGVAFYATTYAFLRYQTYPGRAGT